MPAELNEEGIRIPPNNELSEIDKAYLTINYPLFSFPVIDTPRSPVLAPRSPVLAPVDSNEPLGPPTTILPPPVVIDTSLSPRDRFLKALDTVGVDGQVKNILDLLFADSNWREIRSTFTQWSTAMRLARKPREPPFDEKPLEFVEVVDGCAAEPESPITIAVRNSSAPVSPITAPPPDWEVAVANFWTPGETVTYTWVQGTTEVSQHRKERIRETMAICFASINLKVQEVPMDPNFSSAKVHIYFGPTHIAGVVGWSKIGNTSVGSLQTDMEIHARGGTVETTVGFTDDALPMEARSDPVLTKREQRACFHQIGHVLGLTHEQSAQGIVFARSGDDPTLPNITLSGSFDPQSIMLYPSRTMRNHADFWEMIKGHFELESADYNYSPSKKDRAFLAVGKFFLMVNHRLKMLFRLFIHSSWANLTTI